MKTKAKVSVEPKKVPSSPESAPSKKEKPVLLKVKGNPLLRKGDLATAHGATFYVSVGPHVPDIDGKYNVNAAKLNAAWPALILGSTIQVSPSGHIVLTGTTSKLTNVEGAYTHFVYTPDTLRFLLSKNVVRDLSKVLDSVGPETRSFLEGIIKNVKA